MLTITKTYKDYNDVERTEEFQFNLTKAEVVKLEMGTTGGLSETLQRIVAAKDNPSLIKIFEDLVLKAYGQKSPDGKRFIKSDALREEFAQTEAYSEIFMELAFDAEKAANFINGIVPAELAQQAAQIQANGGTLTTT